GRTVWRVVKTHDNVVSVGYELPGIPRTVVVRASARQVAEIEVLLQSGVSLPESHFSAAHVSRGDDHSRQPREPAVARRRIARRISRYLHPFVAVVDRGGLMLLEAETNVMHHRQVARQDFHRRHPSVALERSGQSEQLPFEYAFRRHVMWR